MIWVIICVFVWLLGIGVLATLDDSEIIYIGDAWFIVLMWPLAVPISIPIVIGYAIVRLVVWGVKPCLKK